MGGLLLTDQVDRIGGLSSTMSQLAKFMAKLADLRWQNWQTVQEWKYWQINFDGTISRLFNNGRIGRQSSMAELADQGQQWQNRQTKVDGTISRPSMAELADRSTMAVIPKVGFLYIFIHKSFIPLLLYVLIKSVLLEIKETVL